MEPITLIVSALIADTVASSEFKLRRGVKDAGKHLRALVEHKVVKSGITRPKMQKEAVSEELMLQMRPLCEEIIRRLFRSTFEPRDEYPLPINKKKEALLKYLLIEAKVDKDREIVDAAKNVMELIDTTTQSSSNMTTPLDNIGSPQELSPQLDNSVDILPRPNNSSSTKETKTPSLFATAHAALEEDDHALVGNVYRAQATISRSKPENFKGGILGTPIADTASPVSISVLLHASENIELLTEQYKHIFYNPSKPEIQGAEFPFRVVASGRSKLAMTFYYERSWLRTVRLEFDAIKKSVSTTL